VKDDLDVGARVKSAERVLDLIETLAGNEPGLSFPALSQITGFPKSSLHALLGVLTARRYLAFDETTRLYSLGSKIWENGQAYLKGRDIVRDSLDAMRGIVALLNETVQLASLDGTENVYLAKVDSTHPLRLQSDVGGRLSAHATGLGKALLASLADAEVRSRFARKPLAGMTPNTITTMPALLEELAVVRRTGYSVDNEEYTPGLFCIAVPIRDHLRQTVAAVSVSFPLLRIDIDAATLGLRELASASLAITARMGGQSEDAILESLTHEANARAALVTRGAAWSWMRPVARASSRQGAALRNS